jgi:hypothetical protein
MERGDDVQACALIGVRLLIPCSLCECEVYATELHSYVHEASCPAYRYERDHQE